MPTGGVLLHALSDEVEFAESLLCVEPRYQIMRLFCEA
jgi:hypothetical protein